MARPSYARWSAFLARHHRAVLLASLVLGALCALSLGRLRLDIDVFGMLPRGRPAFDDFRSFVADFGELNQLVILVDGPELRRLQRFAAELEGRLAGLDTVRRVQARVEPDAVLDGLLGRWLFHYIPDDDYAEVARRLEPAAMEARVAGARAALAAPFDLSAARMIAEDPLGLRRLAAGPLLDSYGGAAPSLESGYFVAADRRALLVFVRPPVSPFDTAFTARLMAQVKQAVAETRAAVGGEVRVEYTGSYAYALEDAGTLQGDVGRYTALALAGVLLVFYGGYRNLGILPFVTYPLVLTTVVTFAASLLLYDQLNAVSLAFAAILYGLSVDAAIHFYTRLLAESRGAGEGDRARLVGAVAATLGGLGRPNIASSLTTAAAFLVIGASALVAVSQLAVLTAVGMAVSTVLFFTLYPAMAFAAPRLARGTVPLETPRLERLGEAAVRRRVAVCVLALVLAAVALWFARQLSLDVTLTHLRPRDSDAVRVQDEIAARFGLSDPSAAVVVRRPDLDAALADMERIVGRLRSYRGEGLVEAVQSVDGVLPSPAAQRARLRALEKLPRAEAAAALREALARQGFAVGRFEGFLAAFTAERDPESDLIRYGDPALAPLASLLDHHVQPHDGEFIVAAHVERAPAAGVGAIAERLRRDLPGVAFAVASRELLEEDLGALVRGELRWFCILGVAGNLALLALLFRRVGVAAAILAPVLLAVLLLLAGMAITGVALDPVNLIVTPLVFGMGVDYGVYIAAHARECGGAAAALRSGGRAIVVTALTTIAGFGFLAFSRYPFLATMGLLTGAGLALCLLLSIVLLPALLALSGVGAEKSA